jgi:uncharacterized coiled-coil protein SlyX
MIARQCDTGIGGSEAEAVDAGAPPRSESSPLDDLFSERMLDEAMRLLQEDLAILQAEQERGLGALGGTLDRIGQELNAVRAQLAALAEPLLTVQLSAADAQTGSEEQLSRERQEIEQRFERIERQVALLVRGMDSIDGLRYQSDVHTRALARLTDLIGEVVRPRPIEGLEPLQQAVSALERSHKRSTRLQLIALSVIGLGLTPGIGALAWILLRGGL